MKFPASTSILLAFVALSACGYTNRVYTDQPVASGTAAVTFEEGATIQSVVASLEGSGFHIVEQSQNQVVARGNGRDIVNCGTITQTRDGNRSTFPATAPISVIYIDPVEPEFATREVEVDTQLRVIMDANVATVTERHYVSIFWSASDGRRTQSQAKAVAAGQLVTFADRTKCTTGSVIAGLLR